MRLISFTLAPLFCGLATVAFADDVTVQLSDTPAAVQKAIQAQVGDGKMGDITKCTDDNDLVFDVDLTAKDGAERDFTVAQDGTLLSKEVTLAETPDAAQKTVQSELSGGTLESIDKNLADADVSYDVEGTGKDGKEKDFTVADDGTVLSREVTLAKTPDAIQKAIAAQLNGGKVTSIDENFDEDGTNFDVGFTTPGGTKTSFNMTANGTLASKQVEISEVPRKARDTIMNQIGDGTVLRIDKSYVKQGNFFPYEVEGRKNGKTYDFSVAPRGRFLGMAE